MKLTAVITAIVALGASSAMAQTYSAEDCAYKNNVQASTDRQTTASVEAPQEEQPVLVAQRPEARDATAADAN